MSKVGLFAHVPTEHGEDIARDAIALALALMTHEHRLLLHVSPNLATPLLLAGEAARAQLVLEDAERRPHPLIMLPSRQAECPEAALFVRVESGGFGDREAENQERRMVSLFSRFEALGVVDGRWIRSENRNLEAILTEETPEVILAMGWSESMAEVIEASESYARRNEVTLLMTGPRIGPTGQSERWRDLEAFTHFSTPEVEFPLGFDELHSEELSVAWRAARRRARLTLAAEALAIILTEL